ncbi:PREDICTED: cysteine-rich receptor-like protein kinase 25 [Lupinus angustifolius]|uniref:cysteine-rich receptor-like protein kinase 25 n=1 Tax=Lupinus angustifolius TaxID=3871 RepID=UPI00092EB821|nr:PREDICTED: cysteine-rich receptor-like protein kinase 25 [Lupinus angustifolius]
MLYIQNHSSPLDEHVMLIIKLILHIFFLTFLNFSIANDHMYLKHSCSSNNTFTLNSTYQSNLHTILTTLSSHAATIQFYNTTVSATSETVYGLFMCRGDVTSEMCQECIAIATKHIASRCVYSKEAVIWYHMCMVRYSNRYFFSTVEEWPRLNFVAYNVTRNVIKKGSYGFLLANTLNDAVAEAANADPLGNKKFATRNVTLPGSLKQKVYVLVQCTPDLSRQDCNRCLSDIMSSIPFCCLGRDGGMVLYPSCNFMYALDLFYRDASIAVAVTPTPLALEESALPILLISITIKKMGYTCMRLR